MNSMPKKLRNELAEDLEYTVCMRQEALQDHECQRDPLRPAKLTEWEHTLYFAGKQVQKKFAVISLCWWAHRGPGLNKELNVWISLNRATQLELLELSKAGGMDYCLYRGYLNTKYGTFAPVAFSSEVVAY